MDKRGTIEIKDLRELSLFTIWTDCTEPDAPKDGSKEGEDLSDGSEVTFSCNEGYTLVGEDTLTCNNGVWDNDEPTCIADASVPPVPSDDPTSEDELTTDSSAAYINVHLPLIITTLMGVTNLWF
ncbi:C4b-binding protein-like [Ptychodera flava]|uniref:C4b-binding protein-like n=1 Tax=Ptychodera flava TaxID=63121 RepID=UPI00396A12E8